MDLANFKTNINEIKSLRRHYPDQVYITDGRGMVRL